MPYCFGTCRVTRKRFDFYVEHKSEIADIIIHQAIPLIRRLGGEMKVMKSDNGGELPQMNSLMLS
jgi:hypothetical protein